MADLPRDMALVGIGLIAGLGLGWLTMRAPTVSPVAAPAPVAQTRVAEVEEAPLPPPPSAELRRVHVPSEVPTGPLPNILVLIADDVGQDMISLYGDLPNQPATPTIDALAAEGVTFLHAIANPVCSPTRATLLTGRYAWRYGVGNAIPPKAGWALPESERILPVALREGTAGRYTSAAVGKWHLASPTMGGYDHPRKMGFDRHVGTMGNLIGTVGGQPQTYFRWQRVVDGQPSEADGYITSTTIDDVLELTRTLPEPWLLYVGFHAAHFPMHPPPRDLYTTPLPANPSESDLYRAMVEALDTEMGRLFRDMDQGVRSRTDVVFLGDNGSAPTAVEAFAKGLAKGSLARGGIRVPFVVSGPDVTAKGTTTSALVNTTDLYATVLDLVGLDEPPPADSISFAGSLRDPEAPAARKIAYAERFSPNGPSGWTYFEAIARDDRYKLLLRNGNEVGLFDLVADPMERRNLFRGDPSPELRAALRRLRGALPDVATVKRTGEHVDAE